MIVSANTDARMCVTYKNWHSHFTSEYIFKQDLSPLPTPALVSFVSFNELLFFRFPRPRPRQSRLRLLSTSYTLPLRLLIVLEETISRCRQRTSLESRYVPVSLSPKEMGCSDTSLFPNRTFVRDYA
jgi:hypothetical protein